MKEDTIKSSKRKAKNTATRVAKQAAHSFDLGSEVTGALSSARDSITSGVQGLHLDNTFNKKNLPIALASFAIGAAVGILGALAYPMIRDSELVQDLGAKVSSAGSTVKQKISEGVAQAKTAFDNVVGEELDLNSEGKSPRVS